MNNKEGSKDKYFRIDWQGYNTENPEKREERVDVSPAGTEGIFIDGDSPEYEKDE